MTRTDGMLHGTSGPRPHASLPPMRVLLVNDTEKPIGELRQALTRAGYTVLDDVASVSALLHAVQSQQPDMVVIDVDSPSRDTLEHVSMLHAHAPLLVAIADRPVTRLGCGTHHGRRPRGGGLKPVPAMHSKRSCGWAASSNGAACCRRILCMRQPPGTAGCSTEYIATKCAPRRQCRSPKMYGCMPRGGRQVLDSHGALTGSAIYLTMREGISCKQGVQDLRSERSRFFLHVFVCHHLACV